MYLSASLCCVLKDVLLSYTKYRICSSYQMNQTWFSDAVIIYTNTHSNSTNRKYEMRGLT